MDEERQSFPPNELLIRIDERTRMIAEEIKILREQMITRAEFGPVRLIAFGLVALIMTMVLTAVITQVVTGR
jgi:hypothetical protein